MDLRTNKTKTVAIVGAAAALTLAAAGTAIATSDDDAGEQSITGAGLKNASDAALAETGGGKVTATEVEDEESQYEVEVTLEDGSQVDVQLDENFEVVDSEAEDAGDDG